MRLTTWKILLYTSLENLITLEMSCLKYYYCYWRSFYVVILRNKAKNFYFGILTPKLAL